MPVPLLLGIDIGTSSSKGVLTESSGQVVARAERSHALSLPRPGWAEHDAEKVWWSDFVVITRELLTRSTGSIEAVAVSGIGPCVLPVDGAHRPLRPAILYGIDTRATAEIDELTARYGAERILERGGSPLTSQAVGPKLLWLRHHEPLIAGQMRRFFMASSFIVHRLTGEYVLDHHSASQCDPLYDLSEERWIPEWASDVAPELELPRLCWPSETVGRVTDNGAAATGIPVGTPVAAGTIDAWSEAASAGIRVPGDTMLMYGTTMFLVEVVTAAHPHPAMWTTAGIFKGSPTLAAGMATSGALTSWFRALVGEPPFETLLADAERVPAGASGLVALPYFAGERTPLFDPEARGVIAGLTLSHGRGHLYRALLEATAYGVRHILETMAAAGAPPSRILAVGGGTRGGLWTQIVSDVTGQPQTLPRETIGASHGDALLAAISIGLASPETPWNQPQTFVVPDPQLADRYGRLYEIYRSLYPATRAQVHALARLQETAVPWDVDVL